MGENGLAIQPTVMIVGQSPRAELPTDGLPTQVIRVEDLPSAAEKLSAGETCDLVVLGPRVAPADAMAFLSTAAAQWPDAAVVVAAESPSVDWAVRLVRAGAYDYLPGPLTPQAFARLVEGMNRERTARRQDHRRFICQECPAGVPIVGHSSGMVKMLETIRMVAQSRCNPILILGETGTGKELAARAVHAWRVGDFNRFVAVNCATLTANLLESELFGHVKGAFTGADRDKTGLLEAAQDGSIFLDEISEMPIELQAKLLRFLQEKTFRKVGGTKDLNCNATIIASSNRNLLEETEKGKFRRDLYYRLAVFPIRIPSLSDPARRTDIPLLAEFFLQSVKSPATGLTDDAHGRLMSYPWPGNVRELRNVIERASILCTTGEVTSECLVFDHAMPATGPQDSAMKEFSLEAAEREFILRALRETGWQRTRAAMLLGITRATLHAKLKRYDIRVPDGQPRPTPS